MTTKKSTVTARTEQTATTNNTNINIPAPRIWWQRIFPTVVANYKQPTIVNALAEEWKTDKGTSEVGSLNIHHVLPAYTTSYLGVPLADTVKVCEMYNVVRKGRHSVIYLRCVPDSDDPSNWRGVPLGGSIVTYKPESFYLSTLHRCPASLGGITTAQNGGGVAFFGGHLLGDDEHKTKSVGIVKEEGFALLCTLAYPDILWLATGGALTAAHLSLLQGRDVALFPDRGCVEAWWALAEKTACTVEREFTFGNPSSDVESTLKTIYRRR